MEGRSRAQRPAGRAQGLGPLRQASELRPRRPGRPRVVRGAASPAQGDRGRSGAGGPHLLSRRLALAVHARHPGSGGCRTGERGHGLAAGRRGEAVRRRRGVGRQARRRGPRGVPRVPGVPDRPLPGQGDGAEPARLPFCQHHLRAGLEPELRRQRADHRLGDGDGRRPRRLLRRRWGHPRHGPEPPPPAALPHRDGASELTRPRSASQQARRGPRGRAPVVVGGVREERRCGPVRRLPRREGRCPRFPHAHLRGDAPVHRQLALAGRAVLPALGQGDGREAVRDRHPLQGAAAHALRAAGGPRARAERAGDVRGP